jgi:hypothetical protein
VLENSRMAQTDQEIAGSARFFSNLLRNRKAPPALGPSILQLQLIQWNCASDRALAFIGR